MFETIVTVPDYDKDVTVQTVERWLKECFKDFGTEEAVCYYRYPIVRTNTDIIPDLTLVSRQNQPLVIRCLSCQIDEILDVTDSTWTLKDRTIESPLWELDDFITRLGNKFRDNRVLRGRLNPQAVLALPLIAKNRFEERFGALQNLRTLWANGDTEVLQEPIKPALSDTEWQYVRSIIQGATPLNKPSTTVKIKVTNLGSAIIDLDTQIKLLDKEQEMAVIQIPDGPQRIRGLAGTGKTVLLAMKAAYLHVRFPDKKILFTFNTQSLYNQAMKFISNFYHDYSDGGFPDWEMLHIRHAWGGRTRAGVYSDICDRQGVPPFDYRSARAFRPKTPFQFCCERALKLPILPEYDFILVDEAQDFPNEFFRILLNLSYEPHRIYWAYDELQSLTSLEIPRPEDQYGLDENGKPRVSLEGDSYPGGIEKDFVLYKSYRCPQPVLMLAHAIGLGLHGPGGPIQMLANKDSWESIGYVVESGQLHRGEKVIISRPSSNSPNRIAEIYNGQPVIIAEGFDDREDELDWIAESIQGDIEQEGVLPEQIVVISLDGQRARTYLTGLQTRLMARNIASTIPGLIHDTSAFAESGRVTLSTIFRAKGNEAYVVYILSFDSLYDYVEEIENRNKAFTSITRTKAWVRITGTGKNMVDAKKEIDSIIADLPQFKFGFPDMASIRRRLDSDTGRRRREKRTAKETFTRFASLDPKALRAALAEASPEEREAFFKAAEDLRENQ